MANTDAPRGATPVGTISGSSWSGKVRRYTTDTAEALFLGDFVALDPDGKVRPANVSEDILGVCVGVLVAGVSDNHFVENGNLGAEEHPGYAPASGGDIQVLVAVGPDIIYMIQDDASGSAAANEFDYINNNTEIVATAGSTTTGRSAHEISRTGVGTASAQVRIIGHAERPDNDVTLDNADWLVVINEHTLNEGLGT